MWVVVSPSSGLTGVPEVGFLMKTGGSSLAETGDARPNGKSTIINRKLIITSCGGQQYTALKGVCQTGLSFRGAAHTL